MAKEDKPGVHTTDKPGKHHPTVALPTNKPGKHHPTVALPTNKPGKHHPTVALPTNKPGKHHAKFWVGGHLITNKTPDGNKIVAILLEAWKTKTKSEVSAKCERENLFRFGFKSKEDRESILSQGPWFVEGQLIVLKICGTQTPFNEIDFTTTNFWVQAHNLPRNKMSRKSAEIIGNQVGEFRAFDDAKKESFDCRTFLRLKIKFNITESLPSGFYLDCQPDAGKWIAFKYEKLQDFCYACGKLGHEKQDCLSPLYLDKKCERFGPGMKLNDSSQSYNWLTIRKNGAPSTTMDSTRPKQITIEMGETHPSHPGHELKLVNYKGSYTCDGCKEHGVGKRYRCKQCKYTLHEACMCTSITPTKSCDFFKDMTFKFSEQPRKISTTGNCNNCTIYCSACGKLVKGFVYCCQKGDKDLHPCCSNLKNELEIGGVKFRLLKINSTCSMCNQKKIKNGWSGATGLSYVSECGEHNIHVYCFMEMLVEGLKDGTANDKDCSTLVQRYIQGHSNKNSGDLKKYLRIGKILFETILSILLGVPITPVSSIFELLLQK